MSSPARKRTEAVSAAQNRYYIKNRDARLAQMRERAKQRNVEINEACEVDPVLLRDRRSAMLAKYYKFKESVTDRQMEQWHINP